MGNNLPESPRELPEASRGPPGRLRRPQDAPRAPQDRLKSRQERPKSHPGAASETEASRRRFWIPRSSILDPPGDDFDGRGRFIWRFPGGHFRTLFGLIQPLFLPPPGPAETQCQTHEADTRSPTRTRHKKTKIARACLNHEWANPGEPHNRLRRNAGLTNGGRRCAPAAHYNRCS